jgi:hypothetical protein
MQAKKQMDIRLILPSLNAGCELFALVNGRIIHNNDCLLGRLFDKIIKDINKPSRID